MTHRSHVGRLLVSIDTGAPAPAAAENTSRLVDLFTRQGAVATWAAPEPAVWKPARTLTAFGHELAVLAEVGWFSSDKAGPADAAELARRVGDARAAGRKVSSVVSRDSRIAQHTDLLAQQQISMVASGEKQPAARAECVRFGVWRLGVSALLPTDTGWSLGGGFTARRAIQRAIASGETARLHIEAAKLTPGSLKTVAQTLQFAVDRRDEEQLAIETIASFASSIAPKRERPPMQSALRRAA